MPMLSRLAAGRSAIGRLAVAGALAGLLAGCTAGATIGPSPDPSSPPVESPPTGAGSDPGAGGSVPGAPGSGVPPSGDELPLPSPIPTFVTPTSGVLDPRPIDATGLSAEVTDGRLVARVDWVSGVAPCSVLARVEVERTGSTYRLTVLEGPTQLAVACPEIAMFKATLVDLGPAVAGSFTIQATGTATPVTVTIP